MPVALVNELVTTQEAWDHVFKDINPANRTSDERDALARIINGVSATIQARIGPVRHQTFTELYDPRPSDVLFLARRPIVSVSSVSEGLYTLTENTEFYVYKEHGYLRRYPNGGWWGNLAVPWGMALPMPQAITVTYVAGRAATAADVPWDLKSACLLWVHEIWGTGPANLTNLLMDNGAFVRPSGIPPQVKDMLEPYVWRITGAV